MKTFYSQYTKQGVFSLKEGFSRSKLNSSKALVVRGAGKMAYQPGDVILQDNYFAVAVANENLRKVCSWCLKGKAGLVTISIYFNMFAFNLE